MFSANKVCDYWPGSGTEISLRKVATLSPPGALSPSRWAMKCATWPADEGLLQAAESSHRRWRGPLTASDP